VRPFELVREPAEGGLLPLVRGWSHHDRFTVRRYLVALVDVCEVFSRTTLHLIRERGIVVGRRRAPRRPTTTSSSSCSYPSCPCPAAEALPKPASGQCTHVRRLALTRKKSRPGRGAGPGELALLERGGRGPEGCPGPMGRSTQDPASRFRRISQRVEKVDVGPVGCPREARKRGQSTTKASFSAPESGAQGSAK
jgi:hypothetical protein